MDRSFTYHNKIALKLISSKFTSIKASSQVPLNRLIVRAKIRSHEPEANAATLSLLFGQKPAFHKTKHLQEGDYVFNDIYLTTHKQNAAKYVDIFSTLLLPFQLENRFTKIKPASHNEFSWQAPHCLPSTILNPVFFPYPVTNNSLDLILSILPDKNINVSVFYLNLLRTPLRLT